MSESETNLDQKTEDKDSVQTDETTEAAVVESPEQNESEDKVELLSGKVIKLEDLEEESEYDQRELDVLTNLYDKTILDFSEGEIVKGKVLSINDKEVAVDIGFKSEGVIPLNEFKSVEDLSVGDEIDILLDKMEDNDGQLRLSKEKADFARIWDVVVQRHEDNEIVEGKCVRRIKGGMVVDLQGLDAFLPGSQIDVKPVRDFDSLLGQTMEFRIVKVNHLRKNIVISRRVIIEEGLSEQREKILEELEKGQVRWGVVKNITDFGVFIDLGGVDGLLHITDLSWGRVAHPSEIVSLDEQLKVVILDFDSEKKRVSLGLKQLQPHPWENVAEKFPVGAKITGKVVSITDYGAFVELEKGIEGLIHISEMSWTQHIKHPSKILSIGEDVEAVVLNFDKDDKKISLGLKQIDPDPWTSVVEKYPVGTKHDGNVRNVTNFGVFVELEEGIDGLVHISDLSWTKKVRHPSEIVKKGDAIAVVILNVSIEDRRISLGHKQIEDNPWESFEGELQKGVVTKGKVVRHVEKGTIVELVGGFEGFVPSSHVQSEEDGTKKAKKQLNVGDEVALKIIEFDKDNKKIVLSHSEYIKDVEEKDVQEYLDKQSDSSKETPTEVEQEVSSEEKTDEAETVVADEQPAETAADEKEASQDEAETASAETSDAVETETETVVEESVEEEIKEKKSKEKEETLVEAEESVADATGESEEKADTEKQAVVTDEQPAETVVDEKEASQDEAETASAETSDAVETETETVVEESVEEEIKKKKKN